MLISCLHYRLIVQVIRQASGQSIYCVSFQGTRICSARRTLAPQCGSHCVQFQSIHRLVGCGFVTTGLNFHTASVLDREGIDVLWADAVTRSSFGVFIASTIDAVRH